MAYKIEDIIVREHKDIGFWAAVVIDDTTLGPALGGTRMRAYETDKQAIEGAITLAGKMTYKSAIANIPYGGGAGVILRRPGSVPKEEFLHAYAELLNDLDGRFISYEDAGITEEDAGFLSSLTPYFAGGHTGETPAKFTALGVLRGIEAAVKHYFGRDSLAGLTVSIQGVGKVGSILARTLYRFGCEIVLSDFHRERAERIAAEVYGEVIDWRDAHRCGADIYTPCGIGPVLDERRIPELTAQIVAGSCSSVLANMEDAYLLHERGVLYAPDFVINSGGLFNVVAGLADYGSAKATILTNGIYATLERIFDISDTTNTPTAVVATKLAEEKLSLYRETAQGG